jgi:hypothetical protein
MDYSNYNVICYYLASGTMIGYALGNSIDQKHIILVQVYKYICSFECSYNDGAIDIGCTISTLYYI